MRGIFDRKTTPATVRLEGELIIDCAAELQAQLREALASGAPIQLDFAGVTQVDVTGLQLLTAAERAAKASGVVWVRSGAVPECLLRAVEEAGWEGIPGEAA